MKIQIDYIPFTEQAIISNDGTDKNLWASFRNTIYDYIGSDQIDFSEHSMSFPWRYFLKIKTNIGYFAQANENKVAIAFTNSALQMIKVANSTDYNSSIKKEKFHPSEITQKLLSSGFQRKLTDNQLYNLCQIGNLPSAATFSVPGAGKTTEALAYFFINCTDSDRLLVVAPKNAFGAWDEQLAECVPGLNDGFIRLRGGEESIQNALLNNPRFMLITYDQLTRVPRVISSMLSQNRAFMFLDESHRIKGGKKVRRGETILNLSYLPIRKMIMSGTPMPQSTNDLVPQFSFLYPTKDVTPENVVDIMQPIYVRTTQDQLGTPRIHHVIKRIEMPEIQKQLYLSLKSEIKRQLNPVIDDTSKYALRKIGKCVMKVMEFVSNPSLLALDMNYVFDERMGRLLLNNDGPKIEYVCKRARELAAKNKKVIIWSSFVQNVELIALRLTDLGAVYIHGGVDAGDENDDYTREGKIKKFHDDNKCMVMVANPAACSEGISLHKICQYAIYLDRSFNAAHFLQSEDRIHRLGMPENITPIVEIVECIDTIDEVIRERLDLKVNTMADALNDSSLKIDPMGYDYDDEEDSEEDINGGLNADDAKEIIKYFFPEGLS